ncbi:MAG: hypothetical protein WCG23_03365 [bacterium]
MTSVLAQDDKILRLVGLELMFSNPQNRTFAEGITALELARKINLKIDIVKKKLNILKEKGIVRSSGVSPKYWLFDDYGFQKIEEDDPVYILLCNFDDVDFCRFFEY